MSEHASTLGALLREARERRGRRNGARVRQADVAEHADITVEWYARIERGSVLPSFDVLSRIAAALVLSAQERIEAFRFVLPEQLRRDDFASGAVFRWRSGDANPALVRFLEALHR